MLKLKIFITFIFLIINTVNANSNEKVVFIDLDYLLKNSNLGKKVLLEIDNINQTNINELSKKELDLKNIENEIKKKENIISKEELKNEIDILKNKISDYRVLKDKMVKNYSEKKNEKLNNFFNQINPIIQNYMVENSIDILLERKNIFIGKKNSDITNIIIEKINKELN